VSWKGHGHDSGSANTRVAIASLVVGIPVTGIAAASGHGDVVALGVVWLGIAMVNVAHSLSRRGNR
jgi:hypothetical protein